jgi:tetratricopeptide (TPR) repeat protein
LRNGIAGLGLLLSAVPSLGCRSGSNAADREAPPQYAHQLPDAGEAAILLGEADLAFLNAELEDAQQMYSAASALAQQEHDVSTQVEALAQTARMLALQGELEAGRPWLERAVELARPEQPLGWSRTLLVRGVFAREAEREEEAAALFRQAYEFAVAQDLEDRALRAAFLLASAGDPDQRIAWTRIGIDAATKEQLTPWLGPLYMNLGDLYMDSADYAQATVAFETARSAIVPTADSETKMLTDYSYGVALRKSGRPADARRVMSTAYAHAQERLVELRNKDRMEWVGKTLRELGEIDLAEGARERGLERMREAHAKLELSGLPKRDPERWKQLTDRLAEVEAEDPRP